MSKYRIGYLIQHSAPDLRVVSGAQLHVTAVVRELSRAGHPVRLLTERDGRMSWSDDLSTWQAVEYGFSRRAPFRAIERPLRKLQTAFTIPYVNLFESLRYADACLQALGECQLLYERNNYLAYGGYFAARALGIPWVIELNGNILEELAEMGVDMSAAQRHVGHLVTRWAYRAADHVVVVSDALKREVVEKLGVPESRVSVVLNGVDLDLFAQAHDTEGMRRRLNLDEGPIVAFVGTFQPWHGVHLLAEAFHSVRQRVPNAQLVMVGEGPGRQDIQESLTASGDIARVRLTGRMPQVDVAAVLACADVLAAPHAYAEGTIVGTPLKILEYMAAGRAIVASTAPIHELVQHGVSGHRVAPGDGQALADGILALLEDDGLRGRYGREAGRLAQTYSWASVAQRLRVLFEEVRQSSGGRASVARA